HGRRSRRRTSTTSGLGRRNASQHRSAYRVIDTAAGDLGPSAARKFDCEAWVPTQNAYRELTSTSNCTTFQARRHNVRQRLYKDAGTRAGTRIAATLNGTLATTCWLVAIL